MPRALLCVCNANSTERLSPVESPCDLLAPARWIGGAARGGHHHLDGQLVLFVRRRFVAGALGLLCSREHTVPLRLGLAAGETVILLHHPSPFSRCINRDDEGVPVT